MNLTKAQRLQRMREGQEEARLQHIVDQKQHMAYIRLPIPKRVVSRDMIHQQAEQAKVRAAFRVFSSFGL